MIEGMTSDDCPWQPGEPVSLETRRLVVRTFTPADVDARVLRWSADPAVAENLWHPPVPPERYFAGLVGASDQRTRFTFLIVHRRTERPIGYIKLQIDPSRRTQTPSVALGERDYWNLELGTEAVRAVQRFAFEQLGVERIESRVYAQNRKVRERLLRFGYREVDVLSEIIPGRPLRKVHVYGIEKESWLARAPEVDARLAVLPDVQPSATEVKAPATLGSADS